MVELCWYRIRLPKRRSCCWKGRKVEFFERTEVDRFRSPPKEEEEEEEEEELLILADGERRRLRSWMGR